MCYFIHFLCLVSPSIFVQVFLFKTQIEHDMLSNNLPLGCLSTWAYFPSSMFPLHPMPLTVIVLNGTELEFHDYLSVALLNHKLLEDTGQILSMFVSSAKLKVTSLLLLTLGMSVEIPLPLSGKQVSIKSLREILKLFLPFRVNTSAPLHTWGGNLCDAIIRYSEWTVGKAFEDVVNCSFCLECT